jgi:hypothetical protein
MERTIGSDTHLSLMEIDSAFSEEELLKKHNIQYRRFHIVDHQWPTPHVTDFLVLYIIHILKRQLNTSTNLSDMNYIYFHCHGGEGRTTTVLCMYDMLFNAKQVSFKDIITRQKLLGGKDMYASCFLTGAQQSHLKHNTDRYVIDIPSYKQYCAKERLKYLRKFYQYCRTNEDNYTTPYSKWLLSEYTKVVSTDKLAYWYPVTHTA